MDGDGYGDPADSVMICGMAVGYVSNAEDCNDSDSGLWARPTEVRQLLLPDRATLTWSAPVSAGANTVAYDLLRSSNPDDFVAASCVVSDTPIRSAGDGGIPSLDSIFYYLVRAQNVCPDGQGPLGTDSSGAPRFGRSCP